MLAGALALQIAGVLVFALSYDSLDFRIYWLGGHVLSEGESLYREQLAAHWFTNTPFMALLFVPLAGIPLTVARVAWQLASVGAFAWACAETMKLARRPSRTELAAVVVAGMFLQPMWQSLFLGQVNPFLLALVMTDVRRVADGRPAGIGIGIAAAIKLTPAVFVVMLLVAGKVRAAFTAAGTFAVCGLAAFPVAPDASRVYWSGVFCDTSRVGVPYISNQSPYGALARIMHGADKVGDWYFVVPSIAGFSGLAVAVLWARKGDWLAAAAVTGVTGLLVSPISWAHHWVWVVPVLVVLLRDGLRVTAVCGYLLFVLSPLWWTPHGGAPRQYGLHGALTLVANCYLVAGVIFIGVMAARLRERCVSVPSAFSAEAPRSRRGVRDAWSSPCRTDCDALRVRERRGRKPCVSKDGERTKTRRSRAGGVRFQPLQRKP
ncbi:glycosyltransferase 87 family protein [Actinomadura roseirufa]|uniref:glycosyltransferase 87 family protein n=1 Tax=Actinomadura roseirufa TaxID=2094049 RepID=UPI0013F14AD3|nr:glycosyltransferase 87 family protein [Actinomadura roseirufa]